MVRSLRKQRPAHARFRTRRRVNCGPVELHELSPLDLPIMFGSNPVDRRLKFREARRVSKGGPPLPCARLGGHRIINKKIRQTNMNEKTDKLRKDNEHIRLQLNINIKRIHTHVQTDDTRYEH